MILMTLFTKFFENPALPRASSLQRSVDSDHNVRAYSVSVNNENDNGDDLRRRRRRRESAARIEMTSL